MKRPRKSISYENENEYIKYLREYYRENYRYGESNDSFQCWLEAKLEDLGFTQK